MIFECCEMLKDEKWVESDHLDQERIMVQISVIQLAGDARSGKHQHFMQRTEATR